MFIHVKQLEKKMLKMKQEMKTERKTELINGKKILWLKEYWFQNFEFLFSLNMGKKTT